MRDVPALDATPACKCGAPAHATRDGLCARGHALKGNTRALVVGDRSLQFWQAAEATRREIVEGALADAGASLEDATKALRICADGLAQATLVRDAAFARVMESGGPLSSDGRTGRCLVAWLQASDRVEKYLRLLGLRRVPKPTETLDDYLQRRYGPTADREGER